MYLHIQASFNRATSGTNSRIAVAAAGFSVSCTSLWGTLGVFLGNWLKLKSVRCGCTAAGLPASFPAKGSMVDRVEDVRKPSRENKTFLLQWLIWGDDLGS